MQSDGDGFCGDVVLDSINMACKDKNIILNQIYEMQLYSVLYSEDFDF